MNTAEV